MAVHYKTTAFIFKKKDRMDSDRVFSVFTKDLGRTEIFAKAIRKIASKLKSGIELFCISDIEFIQGKNRKTLTDAVVLKNFKNIALVPQKLEIAYRACDLVDNFIKGQESDERIWNLMSGFFEKLDACQLPFINYQVMYYYFFWNFVSVLGYSPELFKCAHCGQSLNPDNVYFSSQEGGIICKNCSLFFKNSQKINADVVKILRLFLLPSSNNIDWQIILKLKIEPRSFALLQEVSNNYGNYLTNTKIHE